MEEIKKRHTICFRREDDSAMKGWQRGDIFSRVAAVLTSLTLLLVLLAGCGEEKASHDAAAASSGVTKAPAVQKSTDEKRGDAKKAKPPKKTAGYTMGDVKKLKDTKRFRKSALEHIFDGTINKSGKATGYHYSKIPESRGKIIDGTRSKSDLHGVFTAKVEVSGVRKNGFSSFYPESWSPQDVVDAINAAYDDAVKNPENPRGSLWIGRCGDLEIDMYLDENKKIITAYPIFVRK